MNSKRVDNIRIRVNSKTKRGGTKMMNQRVGGVYTESKQGNPKSGWRDP